jgi:hypothetical protein
MMAGAQEQALGRTLIRPGVNPLVIRAWGWEGPLQDQALGTWALGNFPRSSVDLEADSQMSVCVQVTYCGHVPRESH